MILHFIYFLVILYCAYLQIVIDKQKERIAKLEHDIKYKTWIHERDKERGLL